MSPVNIIICASALVGGLISTVLATPTDTINVANWQCALCPEGNGWLVDIKAGPAIVTDDAWNYGDFTGLDEQDAYLFSDFFGRYRDDDADYMQVEGYTRSSDALGLFMKGGKQSLYEVRGSYQAIPRRLFNTTQTPYLGNGTDNLQLPSNWVRGASTADMTGLTNSLVPVDVGWDWDIWKLGFDIQPGKSWTFSTDYTRRERSGNNRSASSFLFAASEFVSPVQHSTDELNMALSYATDRWQASLTYFGSVFANEYDDLTWENAYVSSAGADSGQLALPPGNESHQLSLSGSVLLPARTTLTGQFSAGHLTQNSDLLPFTTNPTLSASLPATTANAEVDTLNINLRAVSSPWRKVTVEGELRFNDFDNQTPVNSYAYVVTDSTPGTVAPANSNYDYKRRELKLRGEYRLTRKTRLHAGFDTKRIDRSNQNRSRTTTNRVWMRLRTRLAATSSLDIDLFSENRGGSDYDITNGTATTENPLMRKYNMADRNRDGVRLRGNIFVGANGDFGLEFAYGKDDYDNSAIGLNESNYVRIGGDWSYQFGRQITAFASLYNEKIDTEQANSQSFAGPDWLATSDDNFTTAELGVTFPELVGKLDGKLTYNWSQSTGAIRTHTSGLPGSFPDLKTKRHNLNLGISYPYSETLTFGLDYFYEKFTSSDWHLDGVQPNTMSNLVALGADAWNYDSNALYFNVRYQLQ